MLSILHANKVKTIKASIKGLEYSFDPCNEVIIIYKKLVFNLYKMQKIENNNYNKDTERDEILILLTR